MTFINIRNLYVLVSLTMFTEVIVTSTPHIREVASDETSSLYLKPVEDKHRTARSSHVGNENHLFKKLSHFPINYESFNGNMTELSDHNIGLQDGINNFQLNEEYAHSVDDVIGLETVTNGHKVSGINSTNNVDDIRMAKAGKHGDNPSDQRLEEFGSGKLSAGETDNSLPIFLTEPENAYVVKNRPAILKCKAAHALQLLFKCSGSSQPPPTTRDKHVDPHTGVHLEEITSNIHRDLVDSYFGSGPFRCECQAWSSRGVIKSQAAEINTAYLRKQFLAQPTSLRVEIGSKAELHCSPPNGFPQPTITWYKNNNPLTSIGELKTSVTTSGTLIMTSVTLQDMANYTCAAENIAGKRVSESAVLIVYVNGGWSPWSLWRECKCINKLSKGKKRIRTCNNPVPINGGSFCLGPQIQKSADCSSCPEDAQSVNSAGYEMSLHRRLGRWSAWSEWSSCSSECVQVRRRKCVTTVVEDSFPSDRYINTPNGDSDVGVPDVNPKVQCSGKDVQTAECRGDLCQTSKDDLDWTLYLGLAFLTAVCFALGSVIICCARRSIMVNPRYNSTRSALDAQYMEGSDKKGMRLCIESINNSYDYAQTTHNFRLNEHMATSVLSEHHYDIPNLPTNYSNPIDEVSVGYLSDTPDTSIAEASNSAYEITARLSTHSVPKSTICNSFSSKGGSLRLYEGEITLYIPEYAIGRSIKNQLCLMLLSDESSRSILANSSSLLISSIIVQCSPSNYNFLKPVILKIPHCLVNHELWDVNIYTSDSDYDDLNVTWGKIIVIGQENINTPVFVHLEPFHAYIMTERLGRFVMVAHPKSNANVDEFPSIRMKLLAFSQLSPSSNHCGLRIYVVKDFPNNRDICSAVESQLGGSYMGESSAFPFLLNNSNLKICIQNTSNDQEIEQNEHVIPFNHILNNSSILHCEFNIKLGKTFNPILVFEVEFWQDCGVKSSDDKLYRFSVRNSNDMLSNINTDVQTTVCIDRQGKFINDISGPEIIQQLPALAKRMVCTALDTPRIDERDWRLLAKKLNADRYIAYFATKPSPTEQILNLWECRANSSSHVVDLLMILNDMERQDVMDIIKDIVGPLWI